jgi:hypothetical protein
MLYSTEGLGKTTFGASAPAPIFIAPEAGFPRGVRPDLFPQPKTWNDLYDAVRELQEGKHNFKTLVFDTLDWLQPLLFAYIMKKNGDVDSMEKVGGGYGRGYDLALIEMLRFLGVLERLRQTRNMNILFLVHAEITTFKNPQGPDYDHWEPKLQKKISAKVREWCHFVLFGNFEVSTAVQSTKKKKEGEEVILTKGKAINSASGLRMIYTTLQPLYKAKNRHGMPDRLPFDWAVVSKYLSDDKEEMEDRCASLRRQILSALEQIVMPEEKKAQSIAWANGVKVPNLLQIGLNRMMAQLEAQQEEMELAAEAEEAAQRASNVDLGEDMNGGFDAGADAGAGVGADSGGADEGPAPDPSGQPDPSVPELPPARARNRRAA